MCVFNDLWDPDRHLPILQVLTYTGMQAQWFIGTFNSKDVAECASAASALIGCVERAVSPSIPIYCVTVLVLPVFPAGPIQCQCTLQTTSAVYVATLPLQLGQEVSEGNLE